MQFYSVLHDSKTWWQKWWQSSQVIDVIGVLMAHIYQSKNL